MNKKILSVVLILCVMLAVMPMTAYAADIAFCSKCNRIQTVRLTYQYSNDEWHICDVTCTVCNNRWFYGMSHKWSGTATCTSGRTCTECGGSSEPLGHDWGTWTQNSDEKTHTRICKRDTSHTETENCHGGTATCTQRATCTVCGAEYGDALGHDFTTSWTHDDNEHWKQCSRCDAKDDVSPHTWDSGTITTAPTCTKAGKKTYSCTKCDATKIEPIPATGHSWKSDWTSDATHHWYECDNKNCDVTDNAGKKGYAEHSGGKATCTQNAVCEFCKAEYGEKLPHDFTAETVDAKYLKSAATCTEKAVYYKSCAVCGLSSEGTADEATFFSGNALDHNWGAWTQNSDEKTHTRICKRDTSHTETENCHGGTATCTQRATCTVCGAEYGDALGHDFTTSWTHDDNEHWKQCSRCDAKDDVSPHTWDSGTITTAPTCTKAGKKTYSCTKCDATKIEPIPATGHSWKSDWTSDATHHWYECDNKNCDVTDNAGKKGYAEHSGGKATCTQNAVCEFCKAEYGEKLPHDFTAETVDAKYLKSAATCTEKAVYYKSCAVCGLSSEGTADEATFFSGNALDHNWGAWTQNSDEKTHTRICKRDASHTETENCTGGTADCTHKAVCTVCGGEYGELDPKNHTNLKHFPAKAATKTTEGNIEYWYCSGCKKYYKDATATQEIKQADTVTAKLPGGTVKPGADKSPQTGDNSNLLLWMALLFVSGGAAIGATIVSKKKKYNR